jgi:hypothetical protein
MRKFGIVIALGSCLFLMTKATADPQACRDAVDQFNSARSEISGALRLYASCISGSDGHDDCSSEFGSLRSSQDDFETAVSEYDGECQ